MYAVLLRPAARDREAFIDHGVELFEKIGGKGYEPGVEDLRTIATRSYDRGGDPAGPGRQLGAIVADRRPQPAAAPHHGPDDSSSTAPTTGSCARRAAGRRTRPSPARG